MTSRTRSLFSLRNLSLLAIIAVVGLFTLGRARAQAELVEPAQRQSVPEFSLQTLDGKAWTLSEHKGRVVLVNLFATWCPPCRAEMPFLVETAEAYQSKGLDTLAVSLDQGGASVVEPFVKKYKMSFPVGMAEKELPITQGVSSIPVTLLIDRQGRVAQVYVGMVREEGLKKDLDALLAE